MTTNSSPSQSVASNALSVIQEDMQAMDNVIAQRLSTGVPLVGQVAQYIVSSGGKRLRPALLFLMSGALGSLSAHRHAMGAVVEFIHTATLLHDDVVDESTMRRNRKTANEVFGNAASVLVGDFLYSRAFQMMVEVNEMRVLQTLADATNIIAEGEVQQLMNMHDASLNEAAYLEIIRSKTAKLFEASARLAAILIKAPANLETACATYGQAIGTAFQIIDDVLDYDGDAQELGKNLGDDLREGKTTLPLIFAMQKASPQEAKIIRKALENGQVDQLDTIVRIVKSTGALEDARQAAAREAQRAIDAIEALSPSQHKASLLQLANQLLERRS